MTNVATDLPESQQALLRDLKDSRAPEHMIGRTLSFVYHDYESPVAMPKHQLVADCEQAGLHDIAKRAMQGEYDDESTISTEEIVDWMMEDADD